MSVSRDVSVLVGTAASGRGAPRARAAGRLMTLLEDEPHRLPELFGALPPARWPRPRLVLGLTGAPGCGKSTLVDALLAELRRREPGLRLGVVAVDPSSPFTGGALLGDRVRMMRHAGDPDVFIRSVASRGHLGGLSLGVKGVLHVLGLVGCDLVLVETVGVGQSEVEVARVADRVAVVLAPGGGDEVQLLKAGLMEAADLFVITKADAPGAATLHGALLRALRLAVAEAEAPAPPPVHLVSAREGTGIGELADRLDLLAADVGRGPGGRNGAGFADLRDDTREAVLEAARRRLERALDRDPRNVAGVLDGTESVDALVERLFSERETP